MSHQILWSSWINEHSTRTSVTQSGPRGCGWARSPGADWRLLLLQLRPQGTWMFCSQRLIQFRETYKLFSIRVWILGMQPRVLIFKTASASASSCNILILFINFPVSNSMKERQYYYFILMGLQTTKKWVLWLKIQFITFWKKNHAQKRPPKDQENKKKHTVRVL